VTLVTGNELLKWQSFLWRFRRITSCDRRRKAQDQRCEASGL